MSEECNHNCESCESSSGCDDQTKNQSFLEKPNKDSHIKKVIAVVSGKGGVGKSLVTSLLAVQMQRKGYKTGILDADVTGPSIPKSFGLKEKALANANGNLLPVTTKEGIKVMSLNLLLENENDPVVWRGPIIAGVVKQFWTDVIWGDIDYLFVDMPPGTGDVPLTVFQSLPVDGIIIVTSPQELVSMIVEKALKMSALMHIPVLGIIENMSYFICPNCHEKHYIFGKSNLEKHAVKYGIHQIDRLPIDPTFATLCDNGDIEAADAHWLNDITQYIDTTLRGE
jgi:Mrp family chromosome partitioning ATPase